MEKVLMLLVKLILRGKKWAIILFLAMIITIAGSWLIAKGTLVEEVNFVLTVILKPEETAAVDQANRKIVRSAQNMDRIQRAEKQINQPESVLSSGN